MNIRRIVFAGMCAVLLFVPLPIGSVTQPAIFVFEAATLALFLLYLAGQLFGRKERLDARAGGRGHDVLQANGRGPKDFHADGRGPSASHAVGQSAPNASHAVGQRVPNAHSGRKRSFRTGVPPEQGYGKTIRASSGYADALDSEGRAPSFPLAVKIFLGIFLGFSLLQILPLPPSLVRLLSPHAASIYQAMARDGLAGWTARPFWTLSLAPGVSLSALILVVCYGLFGFLVIRTVRTRREIEIFVLVIIVSALFQAFYGMAETFSGSEKIFAHAKKYNVGSVTGTFVNRNHFAGFMEMAFPLSLGYLLAKARYFAMEKGLSLRRKILWFGQESLQWSLLCGLASVFLAIALVFSKSRSGVMIFLVTLVLAGAAIATWREVAAETEADADAEEETGYDDGHRAESGRGSGRARRRPRRRFRWVVRLVAAAVLAVALWLGIGPIVQRFADIDITKDNRSTFAKNTAELIRDFPLAGTGKGTFLNAYAMVEKVDPGVKLSFAHNDYLQFTAENGVVAGACLIAAALWLLVGSVRRWARRRGNFAKGIGLGAMLGVTAILIHGFTDFNLQITANAVYFVALCALLVTVVGAKTAAGERRGGRAGESRARGEGNIVGAANNQPNGEIGDPDRTDSFRPDARMRPLKIVGGATAALVALAMLVFAGRDFLGSHYLGRYGKTRSEARSVQSALPVLERLLTTAETYSANPEISREAARLYVEMVKVENEAANAEKRDALCDKAVAQYTLTLARNPIDAFAQFEMGMAYLYYNYPMLTYAEKAKLYFRRALALKPDDEFLNLNILFQYLTWWDDLTADEKIYATERLKAIRTSDPAFSGKLEQRWTQTFGSPDKLKTILGSDQTK